MFDTFITKHNIPLLLLFTEMMICVLVLMKFVTVPIPTVNGVIKQIVIMMTLAFVIWVSTVFLNHKVNKGIKFLHCI